MNLKSIGREEDKERMIMRMRERGICKIHLKEKKIRENECYVQNPKKIIISTIKPESSQINFLGGPSRLSGLWFLVAPSRSQSFLVALGRNPHLHAQKYPSGSSSLLVGQAPTVIGHFGFLVGLGWQQSAMGGVFPVPGNRIFFYKLYKKRSYNFLQGYPLENGLKFKFQNCNNIFA